MSDALVELRGVSVTYRRGGQAFTALRDVDLSIAPGERVGLVGGSGSGKTTLARVMLGLLRPSAGEVWFGGSRVDGLPERGLADLRSRAAMVFQDPNSSLDPRMRLRDIISEPLRSPLLRRRPDVPRDTEAVIAAALADVGLEPGLASRFPHQLSGGQRQRVAIARALVNEPDLVVADEPVSALDVSVRAQVLNLLSRTVGEQGRALVLISHDLAVVRHLCQRVVVLQLGEVVEHGAVAGVFDHPQHAYTRELLAATLTL